jgi:hypothetical protein
VVTFTIAHGKIAGIDPVADAERPGQLEIVILSECPRQPAVGFPSR